MQQIANFAEAFIKLFNIGGENLMGLVTGILPTLLVLITLVNAIIAIVGQERVDKLAALASKNVITRYTILPILAVFFLTNPMCYNFGKFVEEKYKPAYYDATVSFVHPITGLFPHANAGDYSYTMYSSRYTALELSTGQLAVRYFLVGVVVILIRGIVTERITVMLMKKQAK